MVHLVCTLGDSTLPAFIAAEYWRRTLRDGRMTVHALTSSEAKGRARNRQEWLRDDLRERGFADGSWIDEAGIGSIYAERGGALDTLRSRLIKAIRTHKSEEPICLDVTGGTKIMSLAAVQVAREEGLEWSYIDGSNSQILRFSPQGELQDSYNYDLKGNLGIDIKAWLNLQGFDDCEELGDPSANNLPSWLDSWGKKKEAILLQLDEDLDLRLLVAMSSNKLQIILGLTDYGWSHWLQNDELSNKSRLSRQRIVRRLAKKCLELGGDFAEGYLVVPRQNVLQPYPRPLPLESAILQAESAGLRIVEWDDALGDNFSLDGAGRLVQPSPSPRKRELLIESPAHFAYVTLIGDEVVPSLVGLLYHEEEITREKVTQVERIYLITTFEKQHVAERLVASNKLNTKPVDWIVFDNGSDVQEMQKVLREKIRAERVGLNITSGTKLMALAGREALAGKADYIIYTAAERVIRLD